MKNIIYNLKLFFKMKYINILDVFRVKENENSCVVTKVILELFVYTISSMAILLFSMFVGYVVFIMSKDIFFEIIKIIRLTDRQQIYSSYFFVGVVILLGIILFLLILIILFVIGRVIYGLFKKDMESIMAVKSMSRDLKYRVIMDDLLENLYVVKNIKTNINIDDMFYIKDYSKLNNWELLYLSLVGLIKKENIYYGYYLTKKALKLFFKYDDTVGAYIMLSNKSLRTKIYNFIDKGEK